MKEAVLVTGASGGIGQAIVRQFAQQSNKLIIATDISDNVLELYADYDNVSTFVCDVTSSESLSQLKQTLEKEALLVQTIINNAGVINFFPLTDAPKEQLDFVVNVNTFGPLNCIRTFLPHLIKTKGRVLQISSESSKLMAPFQPYNFSKKALDALTGTIRSELQLKGIQLVSIRPGAIATPLLHEMDKTGLNYPEPLYQKEFSAFESMLKKVHVKAIPAERLAKLIYKAATIKHPRMEYRINNSFLLNFLQFLGEKISSRLISWQLRKHM